MANIYGIQVNYSVIELPRIPALFPKINCCIFVQKIKFFCLCYNKRNDN